MKKTTLFTLLTLFSLGMVFAQQRCDRNLKIAQKYLEKRTDIRPELRDEIESSLDSCSADNGKYFYVKGILELRTQPNPNYAAALDHFKTSAQYDFTRAKTYLGYFYKNGWSTPINFTESLYWIEQAAEDGDDNALYTLGYYYLKGLGDLEPDYEKAVSYFEQSEHKMAKHWLAFCKYFGFGTDQDQYDAENLLETTDTPNSAELLAFLEDAQYGTTLDFEEFEDSGTAVTTNFFDTSENQVLYGLWLEKDWMNEQVIRKLPVVLTTGYHNESESNFSIEIHDDDYSFKIGATGHLETSNLLVELPSPFSEELLHYNIKDVTLNKDIETGIYDMNGEIWVEEFKEDGSPITIRIYSEEALARKIDNSFGLYPTVFSNSLNFKFTVEHQSTVTMSLYDLSGTTEKTIDFGTVQAGEHTFEFSASELDPENLIAVLSVNNLRFARQVIKVN